MDSDSRFISSIYWSSAAQVLGNSSTAGLVSRVQMRVCWVPGIQLFLWEAIRTARDADYFLCFQSLSARSPTINTGMWLLYHSWFWPSGGDPFTQTFKAKAAGLGRQVTQVTGLKLWPQVPTTGCFSWKLSAHTPNWKWHFWKGIEYSVFTVLLYSVCSKGRINSRITNIILSGSQAWSVKPEKQKYYTSCK